MIAEARVAVRLLLQHHPLCGYFADDRLKVAGVAVCSGCLAAVPASMVGLVGGIAWILHGAPSVAVLAGGLVLGLPQLTTYLHRGRRPWRFAVKLLGGLGIGAVVASAPFLPWPRAWVLAGFVALGLAFVALQAVRVRSILATCDACPYHRDWDACPGFRLLEPTSSSQAP